ncbi:MAG TPA: hypothetical protein VJC03_09230, partial [bacterium]|nr:hypothetical protein [bacterium]
YGISNSWEVSMEVPHFWHYSTGDGNHKGLGDINLVGKCLVAEKEDFPAFVLKGVLKTRTGDETLGLGTGDEDYQFAAAASKQIGKYALHGMFGYTLTGKERHPELRNTHFYGMAADYEMNEKWHLAAELSGQRHPDRESKTDPLATFLGFTCRISEKMTGDGGVKIGNTESAQKWSLHSGVTITF